MEEKIYNITKSKLTSLVQYMAYAQKELIYEQRILRNTLTHPGNYTSKQTALLHDRIGSTLPYQADSLGQHINMLLEDYPELAQDKYVINALKDRDEAVKFCSKGTTANEAPTENTSVSDHENSPLDPRRSYE